MDCCKVLTSIFTQMHRKSLWIRENPMLAIATEQHLQLCLKEQSIYGYICTSGSVNMSIDWLFANLGLCEGQSDIWQSLLLSQDICPLWAYTVPNQGFS